MKEYTLKELCRECNVTRRAVQGYEKFGLVASVKKTNRGYLLYGEIAKETVALIKSLQNYGFSVKEISIFAVSNEEKQKEMIYEKLMLLEKSKESIEEYITEINELLKNCKKFEILKKGREINNEKDN